MIVHLLAVQRSLVTIYMRSARTHRCKTELVMGKPVLLSLPNHFIKKIRSNESFTGLFLLFTSLSKLWTVLYFRSCFLFVFVQRTYQVLQQQLMSVQMNCKMNLLNLFSKGFSTIHSFNLFLAVLKPPVTPSRRRTDVLAADRRLSLNGLVGRLSVGSVVTFTYRCQQKLPSAMQRGMFQSRTITCAVMGDERNQWTFVNADSSGILAVK